MKKNELIHLHSLLTCVKQQYEEWGFSSETPVYDELDIGPQNIHAGKHSHRKAVFSLTHELNNENYCQEELDEITNHENTVTWDEALNRLERHSETLEPDNRRKYVEINRDVINSLGTAPYKKLEKLRQERLITKKNSVDTGTPSYEMGEIIYLLD